jgi:hypothetical protein
MRTRCHIKIGSESWCQWTGCAAGREIASKANVPTCSQPSLRAGREAAKRLAPHFKPGVVHVVRGACEHG